MNKWYCEEYEFEVEVIGFTQGDTPVGYCRNGDEIGEKYTCTFGCPVNSNGQGICQKIVPMLFPLMEAVRSGGSLKNLGGSGKYVKELTCPDGYVKYRLTAKPVGGALAEEVINSEPDDETNW